MAVPDAEHPVHDRRPGVRGAGLVLFRSPASPIETDVVGKTIVEVALVVAAGACWISIGHPVIGLVFVVVAALSGVVQFRKETR
ncbi:DUF2568 domain-containing protein [Curtobacterium flaccumfaciens]|nr:DUF2568 domain-containing protein [Curtobacterium flaccumfaciens]